MNLTPHYEDGGLRLFHGSNRAVLPSLADASFDSIVTDPPYELGFMGKTWDSSGIAYDVDLWRECFRVLKPGGYLLSFGGTRTWHRIAVAIEDAGFEVRDSIAWLYGSGFPKSMDVSKAIDRAAGATRETSAHTLRAKGKSAPIISAVICGICGKSRNGTSCTCSADSGPATEDAREWEGWGTALKPAFEPIIVARKPLAGTVAANVLAHGTGALNIDATRVATTDKLGGGAATGAGLATKSDGWSRPWMTDATSVDAHAERVRENIAKAESLGRFPSNVLLDESQAAVLDAQSGILTSGANPAIRGGDTDKRNVYGGFTGGRNEQPRRGTDSGGASRFFPQFSLTAEDIEWQRRLESLPTFRYEAKAPGSERPEVDGTGHATVKPLTLIRWLLRLVTRRGGHTLDLYAGSGTTGEAALLEGMECTLIELEETHIPLILARVRKPLQTSLFGDWEGAAQ